MRDLFAFPNPVNEKAARVVAGEVLTLVVGSHTAADVVLVLFLPAAGLESIVGLCVGCKIFGLLMRTGVVPETVCEECADITLRWARSAS